MQYAPVRLVLKHREQIFQRQNQELKDSMKYVYGRQHYSIFCATTTNTSHGFRSFEQTAEIPTLSSAKMSVPSEAFSAAVSSATRRFSSSCAALRASVLACADLSRWSVSKNTREKEGKGESREGGVKSI